MSKKIKKAISLVLVVLMFTSAGLFIFTLTRPGMGYDPSKVKLDVSLHTRENILTCAFKVYGDDAMNQWIAKTLIKNVGNMPVYDFKINYKVGDYTDWTSGEEYPEISPGETVRDYCWATLNPDKVAQITAKTPVDLIMKYEYKGQEKPFEDYEKIYLLGKNDFVWRSLSEDEPIYCQQDAWDNYIFIPSFVTFAEPETKAFANNIGGGLETSTTPEDMYTAFLKCFDMMREHGVQYIQEPASFWTGEFTQYIQYPKETLARKSGTCIDLAICFAALMEALGIRTYVALIPGHAIPVIELPDGSLYGIEATFVDKTYTLTHFPGETSSDVTASECITVAAGELNQYQAPDRIMVDNQALWEAGMVPSW